MKGIIISEQQDVEKVFSQKILGKIRLIILIK